MVGSRVRIGISGLKIESVSIDDRRPSWIMSSVLTKDVASSLTGSFICTIAETSHGVWISIAGFSDPAVGTPVAQMVESAEISRVDTSVFVIPDHPSILDTAGHPIGTPGWIGAGGTCATNTATRALWYAGPLCMLHHRDGRHDATRSGNHCRWLRAAPGLMSHL